jgi:DNA-binding MarR family transcriptional regulator
MTATAAAPLSAEPVSAAEAAHRLSHPQAVHELFLFRLTLLASTARVPIVRLCQREYGITRREFRVLGALAGGEGISSSALAGRMRLDRARTSRVLTSLVAKGLVQRQVAPADRRETVLQLSTQGRAVLDDLLPRVAALNRELLAVLDETQLAQIDQALRLLTHQAGLMGQVEPSSGEERGLEGADGPEAEDDADGDD